MSNHPIEALLDEVDARMAKVARRGNPLHSRYLDPLEFWCDLAEALGHPRPDQADIPALVSEAAALRQQLEQQQQSGVEAAFAELGEMFPDNELTIDFATRPDGWQQVSIFRFAPPNLRDTILAAQGATLAEAMTAVRQWKEKSK